MDKLMVGHLPRYSKWFTTLIYGSSGRRRSRHEYMDGVLEGKNYVVKRRVCTERKNGRRKRDKLMTGTIQKSQTVESLHNFHNSSTAKLIRNQTS